MDQSIPWDMIWENHAPNFKDGLAHIPCGKNHSFPLIPGPAFGDGSHSTTRLVLKLLEPIAKDKIILDIGVGTGILSIASALLGAKHVYAFEIDPYAIDHAQTNISLNHLESVISINKTPETFDLVLINMISSEQKMAFAAYPFLRSQSYNLLTSGILQEEVGVYLQNNPHLTVTTLLEENGWVAIHGDLNIIL